MGRARSATASPRSARTTCSSAAPAPPTGSTSRKVAIPQADEQQRLLANLIGDVTADRKPLPRFWYLPRDEKAAVVMTGDDHGNGGTAGRFDQLQGGQPARLHRRRWDCIRGDVVHLSEHAALTNAQASAYVADGFEIALHLNTGCGDFTPRASSAASASSSRA